MQEIEVTGESDEFDPETDSKEQILADLKESLRQSELGQTFPLSELWDGIVDEALTLNAEALFLSLDEFERQEY